MPLGEGQASDGFRPVLKYPSYTNGLVQLTRGQNSKLILL